jgi:hypothetical protein
VSQILRASLEGMHTQKRICRETAFLNLFLNFSYPSHGIFGLVRGSRLSDGNRIFVFPRFPSHVFHLTFSVPKRCVLVKVIHRLGE